MLNTTTLAKQNIKTHKSKSLLLIFTILLSTMLLTTVSLTGLNWNAFNQKNVQKMFGTQHGTYTGLHLEQITSLKHHIEIENVGLTNVIGSLEFEDEAAIGLAYMNQEAFDFNQLEWIEGTLPVLEDEMVMDDLALEKLGLEPTLNQLITLTYDDRSSKEPITMEFKLVGITKANERAQVRKKYTALISEAYMTSTRDMAEEDFNAMITLKNTTHDSANIIEELFEQVATDQGIPNYQMLFNEDYVNSLKPDETVVMSVVMIGLIIVLSSILVIYNIFYLSVVTKVQEFGKLRAIGATKKQIRGIILKEGLLLSAIGIPLGLLAGSTISYLLVHYALMIEGGAIAWWMLILVAFISLGTVLLSIAKPMKVASNVSIIEAVRYTGQEASTQSTRVGYTSLTIPRLVKANLGRNKKRTVMTILSLSLSGMIFIVVASVLSSLNAEDMARTHFPYDIRLSLTNYTFGDVESPETEINQLQLNNPINESLIEEIKEMEGVEELVFTHSLKVELKDYETTYQFHDLQSVTEPDLEELNFYLQEGEIDLEALKSGDEIIILYPDLAKEIGVKVGDDIVLKLYDGNQIIEHSFKIQAITSGSGTFALHKEAFNNLVSVNTLDSVGIYTKSSKHETISSMMKSIADEFEHLEQTVIDTEIELYETVLRTMKVVIYCLVLVVGMIGFINLINTMITSVITRKKELGMLQAIGLTDRQLIRLLNLESLFYTTITLISTIFIGGGLGYVAVYLFRKTGGSYANYHFPTIPMIIMIILVVLAQLILSMVISKNFNKQSLIDRVRYSE